MIFEEESFNSSNLDSQYYYLATSDDPLTIKARNTIGHWLLNYPDSKSASFISNFCSSKNVSHLSAFFELYVFSLFASNGFEVKRGAFKKPDLHIRNNEIGFHAECTMAGDSQHQEGIYKHLKGFADQINTIESPYFLNFSIRKYSEAPLRMGRLKSYLKNSLKRHDLVTNPILHFSDNGWEMEISLIKKEKSEYTNFGMLFTGLKWANAPKYLKQAIHHKRPKKYSLENEPYIICVNSMEPGLNEREIKQALYGDSKWDAFFSKTKNRSVSGVLILNRLYPQWIETVYPKYYENPWAKYPVKLSNLKIGFVEK